MPRPLSLAEHTLLAELVEQSLDGMFDDQFPENGSFITRTIPGRDQIPRDYLYYQGYRPKTGVHDKATRYSKYAGPADDPQLMDRVRRFDAIEAGRAARGNLVSALGGAGLPRPPLAMGRVIEALAKAGVFRLRAVLVGTAAYQTYAAVLGMRLKETAVSTGDSKASGKNLDIAQFRSILIGVEDRTPPILEALRAIDELTARSNGHRVVQSCTQQLQPCGVRRDIRGCRSLHDRPRARSNLLEEHHTCRVNWSE